MVETLSLTHDSPPLVVNTGVSLREVLQNWDPETTAYMLVENEDGIIEGIVDWHHIQRLLQTDNPVERQRWEQVSIGSIADKVLIAPEETGPETHPPEWSPNSRGADVVPVHDDAGCVAFVSRGETYVSWSRISAAIRQCHIDPITQLPTRMAFNRRLFEELDRAARTQRSLAVMLIDIDHFKSINDTYGHSAGDAALRRVADCLRSGVRSYDYVARLGGDEFSIICYDCQPSNLVVPITRLHHALDDLPTSELSRFGKISLSIGMAVMSSVEEHCSLELLMEQADMCLYEAKRNGRARAFGVELDPIGIPIRSSQQIFPVEVTSQPR